MDVNHCWCCAGTRYAMLCGRPPFETSTLKETYERIATGRYSVPSHVMPTARDLISRLLSHYPHDRPSLSAILRHEFFTSGYMPTLLNVNCCYTAPKFPAFEPSRYQYFSLYNHYISIHLDNYTYEFSCVWDEQQLRIKKWRGSTKTSQAVKQVPKGYSGTCCS